MKKKLFIFLTIFFIVSFYVLGISHKCKSISNLQTYLKFQVPLSKTCINSESIEYNIKNILDKNQILYKFAKDIKKKFFPNFNKKNTLKKVDKNMNKLIEALYFEDEKNIKGFYNNENILKKLSIEKKNKVKFGNWYRANANNFNNKYIESSNIKKENIKKLLLLAKIDSNKETQLKSGWSSRISISPLYAEGKIFFVTASWEIVAVSAEDYSIIWKKDFGGNVISKRGFLYHKDKDTNNSFLILSSGGNLYKLNANDGSIINEFGQNGYVETGIVLIPPVIFRNQIIVTSIIESRITSVDLDTGKILFSKNIFKEIDNHFANPWGGAALDDKNGIYFIVTGNANPGNIFGNERPGSNRYSNSILAFDIKKKKIIWSFQDIIHDLWDLDISAPPILADVKINDYIIESVIVTTKSGNTYVFDRKTGKSFFDINYKIAGKTNIPGENPSKVQPMPVLPKKFSKIEFKKNDLREELLNDENFIKKFQINHKYGWFVPPQIGKDIIFYGLKGGNNWVGSAYDPIKQNIYIPSNHIPYKIRTVIKSNEKENTNKDLKHYSLYQKKCSSCHGVNRNGNWTQKPGYDIEENFIPSLVGLNLFEGLKDKMGSYSEFLKSHNNTPINETEFKNIKNLFLNWDNLNQEAGNIYFDGDWQEFFADDGKLISKPPWGTITSINIANGKTNWKKPFGIENNKEIGLFNFGGVSLMSSDLLVATGTTDKMVFLIDSSNGEILWKYQMSAEGTAAPLIFNHNNKTFIAVIATGGLYPQSTRASSLYIFGISN